MRNDTLEELKKNNPTAIFENKRKFLTIKNLWNDNSFQIVIDKTKEDVDKLNDTVYLEELIAIYHKTEEKLEFIYTPSDPNELSNKRKFDFNYEGKSFKCYFSESSKSLEIIAKGFQPLTISEKSNYRNLREYQDYFTLAKQPGFVKDFFKDKKPLSFYIKGKLSSFKNDFSALIKSVNFYLTYFDRETPLFILLQRESGKEEHKTPCYSLFDKFPEVINAKVIDTTILDILHTAHKTEDVRLQFIFYYQVLEYCSYYYLEKDIRQKTI